jgi:hypothetical protein
MLSRNGKLRTFSKVEPITSYFRSEFIGYNIWVSPTYTNFGRSLKSCDTLIVNCCVNSPSNSVKSSIGQGTLRHKMGHDLA